jgi:hypothetical protein
VTQDTCAIQPTLPTSSFVGFNWGSEKDFDYGNFLMPDRNAFPEVTLPSEKARAEGLEKCGRFDFSKYKLMELDGLSIVSEGFRFQIV